MKRIRKQLLTAVLAIAMCFSTIPVMAAEQIPEMSEAAALGATSDAVEADREGMLGNTVESESNDNKLDAVLAETAANALTSVADAAYADSEHIGDIGSEKAGDVSREAISDFSPETGMDADIEITEDTNAEMLQDTESGDSSGEQTGDSSGEQAGDSSGEQTGDSNGEQSGDSSGNQGTEGYSVDFSFNGPGTNISGNSDDSFYIDYAVPDGLKEGTDYVVQILIDYQCGDEDDWSTFPAEAYQIRNGNNRKEVVVSYQKIPTGATRLAVKAQISHPADETLIYIIREVRINIARGGKDPGGTDSAGDQSRSSQGYTITISAAAYGDPLLIDPVFRDGEKEFDITIEAPEGKVKDKDYEVIMSAGVFAGPMQPLNPEFTAGTEYKLEETAKGYHVTFYGNRMPKDVTSFLMQFAIHDITSAEHTLLCGNDRMINIQDSVYYYGQYPDSVLVKGMETGINEIMEAHIVNQDYPQGASTSITITGVSVESQTGSGVVSVPQLKTAPSGEGRVWSFTAQNYGSAVMKVTFLDYRGMEQFYTFRVEVVSSFYETSIQPANGDVLGNPGETVQVTASTWFSQENAAQKDVTDQMFYRWRLADGDQSFAKVQFSGNQASVKLGELAEEEYSRTLTLHVSAYGTDSSGNPDYSTVLAESSTPIIISNEYLRLEPAIPGLLLSGAEKEKTVTFHMVRHAAGNEPAIMEGIHFRWNYDPAKIKVTDANGLIIGPVGPNGAYADTPAAIGGDCTFTITRITEDFYSGIELVAEWNQNPEGQYMSSYFGNFYIAPYTAPATVEFQDVSNPDKYYYTPVYWAYEKGITTGTSDTTFEPDGTCNRAQIVTFLWRLAGEPEPTKTGFFRDVAADKYFYKAVYWAAEHGITTGTSPSTFSPYDPCTRGQVVTFLWRFRGQPGAAADGRFKDVKSDKFFYKAVYWALAAGVTTGTSATKFEPYKPCTRAQAVTFLFRTAGE